MGPPRPATAAEPAVGPVSQGVAGPSPADPVGPAAPAAAAEPDPADVASDAVLAALARGDFAAVAAAFEPASAPTAAQVATAWTAKTRGLGALARWTIVDRTAQDGFDTRIAMLALARGELELVVSLAPESHRVASLYLARPAAPAPYADPARFVERAREVGADPAIRLPATLTLPVGAGPFPAVVLVHGSGPNDRDETTGANKIFKDLAEGLATSGIAVLRYEKRTFRHAPDPLTLDAEVTDDAVAAVRALAAEPAIDASHLAVVGHSLGGLLAPEIAVRATAAGVPVAGVVLLAPPGRAPWDIILGQLRFLRAPAATLKAIELAITVIHIGGGDGERLLGIPYAYWRDWASRDGVAMVKRLGKPALVLHGDRDYQVTGEDFAVWQAGLAGVRGAELATLAGDNHIFTRGAGAPNPLEYKVPGHVDARAVARIVAFVRALR